MRIVVLIAILFSLVAAAGLVPLPYRANQWGWSRDTAPTLLSLVLHLAAILLFVAGWWFLGRELTTDSPRRQTWLARGELVGLALLVQAAFAGLDRPGALSTLFNRPETQTSGYFNGGPPIVHLLLLLLIFVASAAAVWPAYGLATRRWDAAAGWLAAGLVALLPGRLLFTARLESLFPLLSLMALYLVDSGLRRRQPLWAGPGGFLTSLELVLNLPAVTTLFVILLFIIIRPGYTRQHRWAYPRSYGAAFGVGLIIGLLPLSLVDRLWPGLAGGLLAGRQDTGFSSGLIVSLYNGIILGGLPALLLAVPWTFHKARLLGMIRAEPLYPAFWLTLLVTLIIGGNTGSAWLALAPFAAVLAARWPCQLPADVGENAYVRQLRAYNLGAAVLAATALLTLVLALRWQTL